ncbi:MAG: bifunctional phosphopantothenoylcysteine decarboxylase/phosphopantothenate--cysteine ligase CoaBC [Candidatus Heimdallarchaeota archaeon]|nr:bifunctional phosphopantothenoylcysteine decarboxylase/phosphopantothenate--cysteine ligase CoaBC [Candidatus Heimdallarchaeota archaeon]
MTHPSKDIESTEGNELKGKVILHCITSSISCFLAPQISRKLMRHGAKVIPVLSPEAAKFINPLIFEWATGEVPITVIEGEIEHVQYAGSSENKANLILIAPITANSISKIANGIMDTTVTLISGAALGNKIPMIIVPTMHEVMMYNPAIKENLAKLENMGVEILYPRVEEEKAKIPEIEEIVDFCIRKLSLHSLKDKKILVTAGPTRAPIDGIRFISNPSTGKMGYALALEAWKRGGDVKIVHGPSTIKPALALKNQVQITTGEEMITEVVKSIKDNNYDYIILAAAMNDFVPEEFKNEKISSSEKLDLSLVPAEKLADKIKILSPETKLALFKAVYQKEEDEMIDIAIQRMQKANADFIIANDVSLKEFGFESDSNKITILDRNKNKENLEGTKRTLASQIFDFVLDYE